MEGGSSGFVHACCCRHTEREREREMKRGEAAFREKVQTQRSVDMEMLMSLTASLKSSSVLKLASLLVSSASIVKAFFP